MMNQDQVKNLLLKLRSDVDYFEVIFSGKKSKRVDGLYKPVDHVIIIHNRNMTTDAEILYTAIHEYAHHIQFTRNPERIGSRVHTQDFWALFHQLLTEAENSGIYSTPYTAEPDFITLTQQIREKYLKNNGEEMKNFGSLLLKASELCRAHHVSFEDYIERILGLERTAAKTLMKISKYDIPSEVGFDRMKTLAAIGNPEKREEVYNAMKTGKSPSVIKTEYIKPPSDESAEEYLLHEKLRLEKRIQALKQKLHQIEHKLAGLQE